MTSHKIIITQTNASSSQSPVLVKSNGEALRIALSSLPVECIFSVEIGDGPAGLPIITNTAEIHDQTSGQHTLTTSNGFYQTGSFSEILNALREQVEMFGLYVAQKETGEWLFSNTTSQQIDVSIEAVSGGKKYTPIAQENTSIMINGRSIYFSLAGAA